MQIRRQVTQAADCGTQNAAHIADKSFICQRPFDPNRFYKSALAPYKGAAIANA